MSLQRIKHSCGALRAYRVEFHAPWYKGQPDEVDVDDAPRASTCRCELSEGEDTAMAARAVELEEMGE